MNRFRPKFPALILAGAVALAAPPASADVFSTIATFTAVGDAPNYAWVQVPHQQSGQIVPLATAGVTNATVHFSATPVADNPTQTIQNLAAFGDIPAELVLTGGGPLPTNMGFLAGTVVPATFSFIYTGSNPIFVNGANHFAGENLLTVSTPFFDFTQPSFFGFTGISSNFGSFGDLGESAYGGLTQKLFSPFAIHNDPYWPWVDSYQAQLTGGTFIGHVPEPSTWALLIMAFGGVGVLLRRRRAGGRTAAA